MICFIPIYPRLWFKLQDVLSRQCLNTLSKFYFSEQWDAPWDWQQSLRSPYKTTKFVFEVQRNSKFSNHDTQVRLHIHQRIHDDSQVRLQTAIKIYPVTTTTWRKWTRFELSWKDNHFRLEECTTGESPFHNDEFWHQQRTTIFKISFWRKTSSASKTDINVQTFGADLPSLPTLLTQRVHDAPWRRNPQGYDAGSLFWCNSPWSILRPLLKTLWLTWHTCWKTRV